MRRGLGLTVLAAASVTAAISGMLPLVGVSTAAADTTTLPATISASALPTPQVDGIIFSVAIVGDTVYAAGRFTKARPAGVVAGGAGEVARTNLLAFSLSTGQLLPFNHTITGAPFTSTSNPGPFCQSTGTTNQWVCNAVFRVKSSVDGKRIYIVGDFTAVDGVARYRIAAFNTATGALDTTFKPAASSRVRAIAVATNAVYLGGAFTSVAGVARTRLAAVDLSGKVLTTFAPTADKDVWAAALSTSQDRLIVGGQFGTLDGAAKRGIGAVYTANGAMAPWSSQPVQYHAGNGRSGYVTDLVVQGGTLYATGADFAGYPAFEGRLAADVNTGDLLWVDQCHGDSQSLAVADGVIYSASHGHDCSMMNGWPQASPKYFQRILAETTDARTTNGLGESIPQVLPVYPNVDGGPTTSYWQNGPWAVATDGTNVVVGGEFLTVNGIAQQGLTRFAMRSAVASASPPLTPLIAPTVASIRAGTVTVTWTATWDRDDSVLTYQVMRDGHLIGTVTSASTFWSRPVLSFVDSGADDGLAHVYRIRAIDSDGHATGSNTSASVTVGVSAADAGVTTSGYDTTVVADGASHYWRLGEAGGTSVAAPSAGAAGLSLGSTVALGTVGIDGAGSDTAATFDGTATGTAVSDASEAGPQTFSLEAWFRTTTHSGGKIIGFGNAASGLSAHYDRHVWMNQDGKLSFGVYSAKVFSATSIRTYNDGAWHHVVATMSPTSGMALYVDGALIASNALGVKAEVSSAGYWHIGGDNLSGWVSAWPGLFTPWTTGNYFAGDLDEVAVYPTALTGSQVSDHFLRGVSDRSSAS